MKTGNFQEVVWQYARANTRTMPWREDTRPYYILVSEIMLQQTQVDRVVPKFHEFITAFPDISKLANAKLSEVLKVWNGLGYARRAKFLHKAAQIVTTTYGGKLPDMYDDLLQLPGVGPNTAGAILTYAYNQPVVFVETNIRTVYLHHFFKDQDGISDTELLEKVEQTLDREHPREWYWALMDYGTYLKKQGIRNISQSRHYKKQSPFHGSRRQVRGQILRALSAKPLSEQQLKQAVDGDERFTPALQALILEGFVNKVKNTYSLA